MHDIAGNGSAGTVVGKFRPTNPGCAVAAVSNCVAGVIKGRKGDERPLVAEVSKELPRSTLVKGAGIIIRDVSKVTTPESQPEISHLRGICIYIARLRAFHSIIRLALAGAPSKSTFT